MGSGDRLRRIAALIGVFVVLKVRGWLFDI